jgi:hypothetical protein
MSVRMEEERELIQKEVAAREKRRADELELLVAESNKKSRLARQVVQEKDKELTEKTARLEELESEVSSGGHADRKIFELARAQV